MNKEEIIKELCKLNQEDLIEISNCLNRWVVFKNKTKTDTLFIRYIAFRGFKSISQFYKHNNINRHDTSEAKAIVCKNTNIKAYLNLKKFLNIDDDTFMCFIKTQFLGGKDIDE